MIRYILSFVAVAKAGTFSGAAKQMGVSKAQLSRHVSQLEATLGIPLLYRTTRTVSLTESGLAFYQNCLALEENYEAALQQLKQDFHAIKGTIRITTTISFGSEWFPEVITEFTKRYPNIHVVLSLSSVTENLIEHNYDIALRVAQTLPDSSLRMRTLMQYEMILCASPQFLKNHVPLTQVEDLKATRCITSINRHRELQHVQWSFIAKGKTHKIAIDSHIQVDSLRAQIQLAALGAGICRVPKAFVQSELKAGTLVPVLTDCQQPPLHVYLLYPDMKVLPKRTQVFMEFLKEYIEGLSGGSGPINGPDATNSTGHIY